MTGTRPRSTIALALVMTCLVAAAGETDRESPMRARLWGALVYSRLSLTFEQTPAREAIKTIGSHLGVPVIGRYEDDPIGYGIDANAPVTLDMQGAMALDVLEEVLEQCSVDGDCTWQIRRGFIEVGTRTRLGVPAARERRLDEIRDFLIDVPDFESPIFPDKVPGPGRPNYPSTRDPLDERRQPEFFALEVVEDIVENVEPGSWDYGQIDYDQQDEPSGTGPRVVTERPASPPEKSAVATTAPRPTALPPPQYVKPQKTATIRYWRDVVIIEAPDYIHRQINGYPEPIPPKGHVADRDEERSDPVARLREQDRVAAFMATPAREVFEQLTVAGVPMVVRYRAGPSRDGIDPDRPITLEETDADTLTILEQVLDRCGDPGACTWQVRRGYVEVGPKSRLSVAEARTLRLHDVRHLMIDHGANVVSRMNEDQLAEQLIRDVVSVIEPGHWEVGRADVVDDDDTAAGATRGPRGARSTPPAGSVFATISYRHGALVVRAPPFIHRRLEAYLQSPR